jgi:hypothetical protein
MSIQTALYVAIAFVVILLFLCFYLQLMIHRRDEVLDYVKVRLSRSLKIHHSDPDTAYSLNSIALFAITEFQDSEYA